MPTKNDCCLSCKYWRVPWRGFWGTCERGDISAFGVKPIATSDTTHCGGFDRVTDPKEIMDRRNRTMPTLELSADHRMLPDYK